MFVGVVCEWSLFGKVKYLFYFSLNILIHSLTIRNVLLRVKRFKWELKMMEKNEQLIKRERSWKISKNHSSFSCCYVMSFLILLDDVNVHEILMRNFQKFNVNCIFWTHINISFELKFYQRKSILLQFSTYIFFKRNLHKISTRFLKKLHVNNPDFLWGKTWKNSVSALLKMEISLEKLTTADEDGKKIFYQL